LHWKICIKIISNDLTTCFFRDLATVWSEKGVYRKYLLLQLLENKIKSPAIIIPDTKKFKNIKWNTLKKVITVPRDLLNASAPMQDDCELFNKQVLEFTRRY